MNKKTSRIAGWALGLSMAVAGIGAAVGASSKTPVEAKAAAHPTNGNWSEVTSVGDINESDSYIFVTGDGSTYHNGTVTSGNFKGSAITENTPADDNAVGVIKFEEIDDDDDDTNIFKIKVITVAGTELKDPTYKYFTASKAKSGSGSLSASDSYGWDFHYNSGFYCVYQKNDANAYLRTNGNTDWRTYASSNGTNWKLYKYDPAVTLDSLTISGQTTSFTNGGTFSLGSATITATYSDSSEETIPTNDEGLSFTLNGSAITTSTQLSMSDSGKSLVVTYTDSESRSASATGYAITVNYAAVSSVNLNRNSATIAKGGTVSLSAGVLPATANPNVKWYSSDTNIATVSSATSVSGGSITVTGSSSNTGDATITAYVDENNNGTLDGSEKYAECAITVSGDPVLNLFDDESTNISSGSINKFTTSADFDLAVVAENFVGDITYTWSTTNSAAVAIKEEADDMCSFDVGSVGSARLSCRAVGATSGDLTVYVDVTVKVPAVSTVSWSATDISVYSNQQLTSSVVNAWDVGYEKEDGASGSLSFGDYDLMLGDKEITTLPYDWSVEDDGEELYVVYGEGESAHIDITVTEHLEAINYTLWSKVTSDSSLTAGDVLVIGEDNKGKVMTSSTPATGTLGTVSATISDGIIENMPSDAVQLTLGGSSGAWTLTNDSDEYLNVTTNTSTRALAFQDDSVTLDIDITSGDATISNSGEDSVRILLNASANPNRFSNYSSKTSDSMLLPELYRASSSNIADTNVTAQRALLKYVQDFNDTIDCQGDDGNTTNVSSKWSSVSSALTTALNKLGDSDKNTFKHLLANASAVKDGDSLQDMLARYEYILAKYNGPSYNLGLSDFLNTSVSRDEVSPANIGVFGSENIVDASANVAITVIGVIGVTTVGGYFFLRRRKED